MEKTELEVFAWQTKFAIEHFLHTVQSVLASFIQKSTYMPLVAQENEKNKSVVKHKKQATGTNTTKWATAQQSLACTSTTKLSLGGDWKGLYLIKKTK